MATSKSFFFFGFVVAEILVMLNGAFAQLLHSTTGNVVSASGNAKQRSLPPGKPLWKLSSFHVGPVHIEDKMQQSRNAQENQYEYFTAAFDWPAGVCLGKSCTTVPNHFVLRGLWPQNVKYKHPWAFLSPSEVDKNQEKLMSFWPNLTQAGFDYRFYTKQYLKYGRSCAYKLNSEEYLNLAISIAERYYQQIYNALKLYKPKGIVPNATHGYATVDIEKAIKENVSKGHQPRLNCEEHGGKLYLVGVYLCLDDSGSNFRDCPQNFKCLKKAKNYYQPPHTSS